ncbi:hypothetical protein JCM4814A_50390 [Streptomyces phaeofaciens JCM 4814]|uniref:Lipoprotein n=1 Tax=Streptomyces phaeofaciens TaxID=68254 RepID=A0A918LPV9_9ACTN|nr:hypothetical protein [Streptomyces phaeofaciens]GGT33325.1 hypothetical protein GCM10010226_07050 [Streptomyces phaeofaciens]
MRIRGTATVVLAAALVAGCGSGGSSSDGKESPSASERAVEAPADPLGAARLKSAAVSGADVDGFQIVDFPAEPAGGGTAAPAVCQPLENMRTASPEPDPREFVGRLAYADSGPAAGSATTVGLMAYEQSDAVGILDGLRTALASCTAYTGGVPARTTAETATAPDAGDEAVAFHLRTEGDSSDAFVVVRSGATVVLFFTASGTGSAAEVPKALVSAQIGKLERA